MESPVSSQFDLDHLVVRPRNEVSKADWDAFVDISPQAWLYHTYDLQDAVSTWPGKSDISFALVDENLSGSIVAILPLQRLDRPILKYINSCWLDSNGAFALHPYLTPKQGSRVSSILLKELLHLGKEFCAEEILMTIPPLTPSIRGKLCPKVNPLLFLGMENALSQTFIIDLHLSKDEIWNSMKSYCRTHIRKAEASGFIIRQAGNDKDMDIYYDLHCQTYRRTGVSPHPYQYFKKIWEDFVTTGRAVVFFAEQEGKVVAANNEGAFKKGMSGWSAAGLGGQTTGVNNLLHWTAIQWAMDQGFEYYESGEGFPGIKSGKRKGLTDFKKSFGGEIYPLFRGKLVLRPILGALRNFSQTIR